MRRFSAGGLVLSLCWCLALLPLQPKRSHTIEQGRNPIIRDDNFEYEILDYGMGRVQVKADLSKENSLSDPVFWVKFRITNKSKHLIGIPRYALSGGHSLNQSDNWGNSYLLWSPTHLLGEKYNYGRELPFPAKTAHQYKPGESSLEIKMIPIEEFVEGITEFRVYLSGGEIGLSGKRERPYFLLRRALARQRNLLPDQADPQSAELEISTGVEVVPPVIRKRR